MTDRTGTRSHRIGMAALLSLGLLVIGGVLVMWSWNTFAVDLFDAPALRYKHALAAELLVATVGATLGLAGWRAASHRS